MHGKILLPIPEASLAQRFWLFYSSDIDFQASEIGTKLLLSGIAHLVCAMHAPYTVVVAANFQP